MKTGSIVNRLIELQGQSKASIAEALKISESTLRERFEDGNFNYREIEKLISILQIEKPQELFFKL